MSLGELIATDRPLYDAQRALRGWFTMRIGPIRETRRFYYDTFDGLLYERGLTLSVQDGERTLSRRDGSAPDPGQGAEQVVGLRELLPVAEISLTQQLVDVLDEREKTVCRIVLETPVGLSSRARLRALRGYDRELRRVHQLLAAAEGFIEAQLPLVDEAVLAAGAEPAGTTTKVDVGLRPGDRADDAVARVLMRLLQIMDANLPGTLAAKDIEYLHDYRVAIRRTRAVIKELKGVFPHDRLKPLRLEFKRLQDATSQTRDLDVYLSDFEGLRLMVPAPQRPDLHPLLDVLRDWQVASRDHMERELLGERTRRLCDEWEQLLAALPGLPLEDRADAARPIAELAGERIRLVHRRMVKMGRAITPDSEPQQYHELRKQGKELRYLLELFAAPLYPQEVVQPLVRALKALQDVLGRHQDREVQVATLKRLSDHVMARAGGGAALLAMGALVEHLEADARTARRQFAGSFRQFSSEPQCKLVEQTFGPTGRRNGAADDAP